MLKALADRFAEAAAEWLHTRVRKEFWGYSPAETFSNEELIKEAYQGIRPAPGYPACPDHTVKGDLFKLLDVPANTGMGLTESFAMTPAAAVSGFYFAHPDSHYFAVSKIGRISWKTGRSAPGWRWLRRRSGWRRCCKRRRAQKMPWRCQFRGVTARSIARQRRKIPCKGR